MIRIRNCFLLLLLICFCCKNLSGQSKTIDSLLTVLKTAKEDTSKANSLNALSEQIWRTRKYNDSRKYADSAMVLSEKLDFKKGMGSAYGIKGLCYLFEGNFPEALNNYQAALKIWEEIGDKSVIAISYIYIATVYFRQSNYSESLKNYLA